MPDREKLEQHQLKGLPTLSHEELLTDLRRDDREDMIIRRPMLGGKGEKISFVCLQGEEDKKREIQDSIHDYSPRVLLESSSGVRSHSLWHSKKVEPLASDRETVWCEIQVQIRALTCSNCVTLD